jgi:DNA ligase-1
LFGLLDDLKDRHITGHAAIAAVNGFIAQNPKGKDLVHLILDKDLKIRSGTKIINKALPGTIPEFSVALAENYNDKTVSKISFDREWFVSRKLDGVRCIMIVDEKGNVSSYSRSGKKFETLSLIENQIKSLGLRSFVFDGEICSFDGDKDNFQSIMKEIRRKNHTIQNASFYVFDFVRLNDFNNKTSADFFNQRLYKLKQTLFGKQLDNVEILEQISVKSLDDLNMFIDEFKEDQNRNHWEGLIVRKDEKYKGKRSRDILKVKTFFDAEYVVQSVIFGPFRYVKNNVEVEEEMLSAVVVEHKGNLVQVGSGFTIDQRKYYYHNSGDIIDKTITVQYFEESQNQLGEHSLRFPVVKTVHGDKRVL